jgi:NADP-dependent 3-hydroxy acid dehydrogenase YdfG
MSNPQAKLFFITGVSSGFGDALARAALAAGYRWSEPCATRPPVPPSMS